MSNAEFKLMIFDLDGTLVDSKADIAFCVNTSFKAFSLQPVPEEVIAKHVGYGVKPIFDRLSEEHQHLDTNAVFDLFQNLYDKHLLDRTRPYEGIVNLLKCYPHISKVVLTNKRQQPADKIIDGLALRQHFADVFGREAFAHRKPDPGTVLTVCKKFAVHPHEAIIIGDTEADVLAGKNAGAFTCAVTYGYGSRQILESLEPHFLVHTVADVSKALQRNSH